MKYLKRIDDLAKAVDSNKKIKSFEDLDVWKDSKELVLQIYDLVDLFPSNEMYGLTSQLKRAAVSIPANIAEGFGRYHYLDKAKFYLNARGSLAELKSHILIATDLKLIDNKTYDQATSLIDKLGVRINNLIAKTRSFNER